MDSVLQAVAVGLMSVVTFLLLLAAVVVIDKWRREL